MIPITFFVSVYNTENYVAECIESILNLDGGFDYEILIVEDASTDNSLEEVRRFSDEKGVRIITHEKNQGPIKSWNEGFSLAQGSYVARIDSDDRVRSNFLEATVPIFEANSEVGLVYGDISLINESGEVAAESAAIAETRGPGAETRDELASLLAHNYLPAPACIARREAWMLSVPMPEWLEFCDWYQTIQIAMRHKFHFVNQVIADYRVHSNNMHRAKLLDGGAERTISRILDDLSHRELKNLSRDDIKNAYAQNFLNLADGYFGSGMFEDARRCYLKAMRNGGLDFVSIRRLLTTYVPARHYETLKAAMMK